MTLSLLTGCRPAAVYFPQVQFVGELDKQGRPVSSGYDTNADGLADFFLLRNEDFRIDRIGYARRGNVPDEVIDLDAIDTSRCRHIVIILDGVGYDLLNEYYDSGGLGAFYQPTQVIAPFPTMTDTAIADILGLPPCRATEARYFDHHRNRLVGGPWAYLAGKNQHYNPLLHYRANLLWDAIGYVYPGPVFQRELNHLKRSLDRSDGREFRAYIVSSAGLGTRSGKQGHLKVLKGVDRLINQILWQRRGLVKITLISDHGHTYTPADRIDVEDFLKRAGWRVKNNLKGPKDVTPIPFGLVTFAGFATQSPAALADTLTACDGIDLASYTDGEVVMVVSEGQKAAIHHRNGRFRYEMIQGDPLGMADVLPGLEADADGFIDQNELMRATINHKYPAGVERLWRAHFALVQNPPDVIAVLSDRYYFGSKSFAGRVNVESTHGGLSRENSVAVIMSTIGPLPTVLRSSDIPAAMEKLTGRAWPDKQ